MRTYMVLALGFFLTHCTVVSIRGSGINNTVSLTNKLDREYEVVKVKATWSKVVTYNQIKDFDIRLGILDLLAETPGDAIINLKFRVYRTFFQGCLQIALFNLYQPYTVKIQGDIVKYK